MGAVILPGSYDPVTLGHVDMIRRAAKIYSEVYAVIFINPTKRYRFSEEERLEMLRLACEDIPGVRVDFYAGRVVDYMRERGIEKIIKGYRNAADLEYEKVQAEYNLREGGFETELWQADERFINISSTLARTAIADRQNLKELLPEKVIAFLDNY